MTQMRQLEQNGALHSIWTMVTPFIGAVCNCTPADCLALRSRAMTIETVFPAEHAAWVHEKNAMVAENVSRDVSSMPSAVGTQPKKRWR